VIRANVEDYQAGVAFDAANNACVITEEHDAAGISHSVNAATPAGLGMWWMTMPTLPAGR